MHRQAYIDWCVYEGGEAQIAEMRVESSPAGNFGGGLALRSPQPLPMGEGVRLGAVNARYLPGWLPLPKGRGSWVRVEQTSHASPGSLHKSEHAGTRASSSSLDGIFVIALVVRFWSLDWQLPFALHPDEGHYVWKAEEMFRNSDLNPRYFRNPSLFTYTILGELKLGELLGALQPRAEAGEGLFQAPSVYMYLGRATSALLGAFSVVVVYALGHAFAGPAVGLLGSLFLALNFLHVRDSHYATNDVPAVAVALLSVWLSVRAFKHPTIGRFVSGGLVGGLATSAKYSMGLCLLPLALAWLLTRDGAWTIAPARTRPRDGRPRVGSRLSRGDSIHLADLGQISDRFPSAAAPRR